MALTPDQLDQLHNDPAYQDIPMQRARDQGWSMWWAQADSMVRTAGDMAIWEMSHAIEHFYETYGPGLALRIRWTQARDMDPQGKFVEMLVDGSFYEGTHRVELAHDVYARIQATDGARALQHLHQVASRSILSNRKLIAEGLNAAYPGNMTHPEQARAARAGVAEIQARVELLLLEQASQTSPKRTTGPRL